MCAHVHTLLDRVSVHTQPANVFEGIESVHRLALFAEVSQFLVEQVELRYLGAVDVNIGLFCELSHRVFHVRRPEVRVPGEFVTVGVTFSLPVLEEAVDPCDASHHVQVFNEVLVDEHGESVSKC